MENAILRGRRKTNARVFLFLAILMAAIYADLRFSFSEQGWISITVLTMTHFASGTWVRQTLVSTLTIIFTLSIVALCHAMFSTYAVIVLYVLSLCVACVSVIVLERKYLATVMMFSLLLLLTNFMYADVAFLDQLFDVLIASFCMIAISIVVTFASMKQSFINLMQDYLEYLMMVIERVCQGQTNANAYLDNGLQKASSWIFAPGLSPRLRSGFRYYLLQLERIVELLLIIEHHVNYIKTNEEIYKRFLTCMSVNKALVDLLQRFFRGVDLENEAMDWMHDLQEFEAMITKYFPAAMTSLHISTEELSVIALLRGCKDLRHVLLQLVMALPDSIK